MTPGAGRRCPGSLRTRSPSKISPAGARERETSGDGLLDEDQRRPHHDDRLRERRRRRTVAPPWRDPRPQRWPDPSSLLRPSRPGARPAARHLPACGSLILADPSTPARRGDGRRRARPSIRGPRQCGCPRARRSTTCSPCRVLDTQGRPAGIVNVDDSLPVRPLDPCPRGSRAFRRLEEAHAATPGVVSARTSWRSAPGSSRRAPATMPAVSPLPRPAPPWFGLLWPCSGHPSSSAWVQG